MYHIRICIQRGSQDVLRLQKRFAGHSKWANIKHTKAEKDAEKAALYQSFARRMKVAIVEGKSTKPLENLKLAQVIEEAKRKWVPAATINGVIEKAEKAKTVTQTEIVDFRGPSNTLFVIKLMTDNLPGVKMSLNSIFRKCRCQLGDGRLKNAFDHQGFVITTVKGTLDSATDDAINVGAEEVEEMKDDEGNFYKFICDPEYVGKVASQLKKLDYEIVSADEEFLPNVTTTINDDASESLDLLHKKLGALEEVVQIFHNIEFPEEKEEQSAESKAQ